MRAVNFRRVSGTRRAALVAIVALLMIAGTASNLRSQRAPKPVSTRADSLLALGRLAAAENELYAAVAARPRAPEARGALGLYLASRARFRIAEILYWEAVQFGADSGTAQRAVAMMAPYRVRVADGPVVTVPLRASMDPKSLGGFDVRPRRAIRDGIQVELDPTISGVVVGRAQENAFGAGELWIETRRLTGFTVRVDSTASPGSVRIGLDLLWPLHLAIDTRAGTLTLGSLPGSVAGSVAGPAVQTEQVPFVLTFPGLALVPRPGVAPLAIESRAGRELVRGARWRVDAARSVLIVER